MISIECRECGKMFRDTKKPKQCPECKSTKLKINTFTRHIESDYKKH